MADLVVIYDPDLELGAIIDTETMRAVGPVGGGPNARAELQQFVGIMPEAVYELGSYGLAQAYMQFWGENFAGLYETPQPDNPPPVVEPADTGDDEAALAELEASGSAGQPPAPAPADVDLEADQGEAPAVVQSPANGAQAPAETAAEPPPYEGPCFACGGSGAVPTGDPDRNATCNLCKGTGRLPAPVEA